MFRGDASGRSKQIVQTLKTNCLSQLISFASLYTHKDFYQSKKIIIVITCAQ